MPSDIDELRSIAAELRLYVMENERYAMVDFNRFLDGTPGGELLKLKRQCSDCRACPHGSTRSQIAFARGDERSPIAFVGEAPDEADDGCGIPFKAMTDSGVLLSKMIAKMGEYAQQVGVAWPKLPEYPYICNVLKCRPSPKLLADDSDVAACSQWLWLQLRLLPNLRVIVALGRVAAQTLNPIKPGKPIGELRGRSWSIGLRALAWGKGPLGFPASEGWLYWTPTQPNGKYRAWHQPTGLPGNGDVLLGEDIATLELAQRRCEAHAAITVVPTWHPLYLLRQPNNKQLRQESWSDLQCAVEALR